MRSSRANGLINALVLARRELRNGSRGFGVFLSCLAIGVAAIAGVGSIAASVIAGLERDGAIMLGGDASLRMTHRDISPEQRLWLERAGDVGRVVYLRSMARTEAGEKRSLVEMKMVDGAYPLYGSLETQPHMLPGALFEKRKGLWGAAVDSSLLRRLGVEPGDTLQIGETKFEIRGIIEREPDRVSGARAIQLGPRLIASSDSLAESGLIRPGSQVWFFYRVRLNNPGELDIWKQDLERAFPDAQWNVRDRRNVSPTIERFVGRTTLFMTLVGLTALLVGGVGVGNAVRSFLSGKMATIATLKCLGASARLVFSLYLIQVTVMALVGIAIGLVIGGLAPIALADVLRETLPLATRVDLYAEPLFLAAAFGLLTALAFSIWPIARACDLPAAALFRNTVSPDRSLPRWPFMVASIVLLIALAGLAIATAVVKMIAVWFVAGALAAIVLFVAAGFVVRGCAAFLSGRVSRMGWRLALANLHRPGAPTTSVVLSLGLGLTVLVTVALVEVNLEKQITRSLPERAPGYFFIDVQPDQVRDFSEVVQSADSAAELRHTPMLRGRVVRLNGKPARAEAVPPDGRWVLRGDRGVTWAAERPEGETVVAGEWWSSDYEGPPLISMAARTANELGLGIGDSLTINILGRNITGQITNLRNVQWGSLGMNFVFIFSPNPLRSAPQTLLATVHTQPQREEQIERAVAAAFPAVTTVRVRDVLDTVNAFLGRLGFALRMTAVVAIVAGGLVLAGAIASGHRRRVYDAVVLKVLGATRWRVLKALLLEYGLLGVVTAAVAGLAGSVAAWSVVTHVMRFSFTFDPWAVLLTTIIAVSITLGLGFYGTWLALGNRAAPLLRNE